MDNEISNSIRISCIIEVLLATLLASILNLTYMYIGLVDNTFSLSNRLSPALIK
jgi:hypothetical protein